MNRKIRFFFLIALGIYFANPVYSQTTKRENFSDIRVDDLNDAKIRDFMREIEAAGLSLDQIDQVALSKGMSAGEVRKLKIRVDKIRQDDARALREGRKNVSFQDSVQKSAVDTLTGYKRAEFENQAEQALTALRSKVFGSDIFRNSKLTFEPNNNIAPPQNYTVGPDDEIIVDIFGLSEANYPRKVSPVGTINIPYAGIIQVSGLSLEEIRQKLTTKLSGIYTGIRDGNTFVKVTLGSLRSIKVTVIGEVTKPGTYTLSSVSTVFTALYSSGGPTENGSYREIEVLRNNKVVSKLDVYDFLLRGDQKGNITLRDQDIIRIPIYRSRVEFDGEVKRPRLFEVLDNETLEDVIQFAGGFTNHAYTARVKVLQNTATERRITDVFSDEFSTYKPKSGDKYIAEPILDRFENRVQINGAVFRPGAYELENGLTLRSLIAKAEGIKDDAFLSRGYITRLKSDGNLELVSFNLGNILKGTENVLLKREDIVNISSIFDLKDEFNVSIDGEVRNPGEYGYAENMNLEDLILKAGGLKEGASITRIEIARRVDDSNKGQVNAPMAEVFQLSIENDLSEKTAGFVLQPFDIVSVRRSEGYEEQKQVNIRGEVLYPGIYFITRKNERISDLIARAGGPTVFAYNKGASLTRGNASSLGKNKEEVKRRREAQSIKALNTLTTREDSIALSRDTTAVNNMVGIDLEKILQKPGTNIDLFLEEGDLINIPKLPQTVKVSGNVLLPVTAVYLPRKGFKSYISEGGGFKQSAAKSRSYIKYANGSVKSTRKVLLFFNDYPKVTPGAEIVVPVNEMARKITLSEIVGSTTGLISLVLLAMTLINK